MTAADLVFRDFKPADAASPELWQECGLTRPWNDPVKVSSANYDRNGAFWVVCRGSGGASVMIGYDGHRGTINYLAIAPRSSAVERNGCAGPRRFWSISAARK